MIALDSSIIVAALLSWHEKHKPAARAVEKALTSEDGIVIPLHSLVESYAVITRLPPPHRLSPADALTLLQENFASTRLAPMTARSVWPLIEGLATAGLGGGLTYDAVILESATAVGATALLTLNARDYDRVGARIAIMTA